MLLHDNEAMKKKIEIYAKEKKIYQDLYDRVIKKIASYKHKIMEVTKEASSHYEQRLAYTVNHVLEGQSSYLSNQHREGPPRVW